MRPRDLFFLTLVGGALVLAASPRPEPVPDTPPPPAPSVPAPAPPPAPPAKPRPAPRPWESGRAPVGGEGVGKISLGGGVSPDGKVEITTELPLDQRMRNIGSHVDGAGMCVSTSMTHQARWQNMREWVQFRDWCAKFPGGGYPSKMEKQVKQFSAEKGLSVPAYIQYEGTDTAILKLALATGRMPSVTYSGRDGVRYRGTIAHMVNLVHLDDQWAAIMDNNGKPEDLIWMSPEEFKDRWTSGGGGWAFIWLTTPPPPPPTNEG